MKKTCDTERPIKKILETIRYFDVAECVKIMESFNMTTCESVIDEDGEETIIQKVRNEKELTLDLFRMCFESYAGLLEHPDEDSWGIGSGRFETKCYKDGNEFEFLIKFVPIVI